ncbi:MAG: aspartate ammonia-lyase [Chloroflexota bacterium]|nr:MAG: aspartate ammonia-lyase [Chloroflexota bacterium]
MELPVRLERDSLGEVPVPVDALYGAQTMRAIENFPISGLRAHPEFVRATALVKWAAAETNRELGLLAPDLAAAIVSAAKEIVDGQWRDQFVVDVFQAGAGTSHNMNANEVIANLANEKLGGERGQYQPVHPNDHVNMGQSTNDVYPTTMRVASIVMLERMAIAADGIAAELRAKAAAFDSIVKPARTHLQDAVPIRLGQEFGGYAHAIEQAARRLRDDATGLREINLGATAAGTGLNAPLAYRTLVAATLSRFSGLDLRPASNYFAVTESMADFGRCSAGLRSLALELIRIANDLRLLSSGPRTAIAEITLPPVQPGSSIMPGKVNPVMAEMLDMVCFQVIGNDLAVSLAVQAGQLDLNVMMPVIAFNLIWSAEILTNAVRVFSARCVEGITANAERCRFLVEQDLSIATALNPYLGYSTVASVVQEAWATNRGIREVILQRGLMPVEELDRALDLRRMTEPGIVGRD